MGVCFVAVLGRSPAGPRKTPGGPWRTPRAPPGATGARAAKLKNPYFLRGTFKRPRRRRFGHNGNSIYLAGPGARLGAPRAGMRPEAPGPVRDLNLVRKRRDV